MNNIYKSIFLKKGEKRVLIYKGNFFNPPYEWATVEYGVFITNDPEIKNVVPAFKCGNDYVDVASWDDFISSDDLLAWEHEANTMLNEAENQQVLEEKLALQEKELKNEEFLKSIEVTDFDLWKLNKELPQEVKGKFDGCKNAYELIVAEEGFCNTEIADFTAKSWTHIDALDSIINCLSSKYNEGVEE